MVMFMGGDFKKIEHQIDPRTLEFVDSRPYKEKVKMLAALNCLIKKG